MQNICSHEAYDIMTRLVDQELPKANTVLHHIREMPREQIYDMYEQAGQRILELAEEEGRLDQEVDVAIDMTEIQYYGDKNDEMVVETQRKKGTTHCHKYATLKVVSGGEQYTIKSIPVNKFANTEDLVEELLNYAEQHIEVRRVYMDREFFSGAIINLMDEDNWTYIMPSVHTSRIQEKIEEAEGESFQRYTTRGKETSTFNLVLREGKDGEFKPFATNCNQMEVLAYDLFSLYGRRWDIETGYRVQKNKFLPKTTSKNYNIRLFLFLFSELLYNCWMLVNVRISLQKYGEIRQEKEMSTGEFIAAAFHPSSATADGSKPKHIKLFVTNS